jgi:curved DNA-binding protein CbpA
MLKKVIGIILIIATHAHAQQLSPIQLQKITKQFEESFAAKKFDDAQTYINQIMQGGRQAYAQQLTTKLAQAREQEIKNKLRAETQKTHQSQAEFVKKQREFEKYKRAAESRAQAEASKKFTLKPQDSRPQVPLSVYQKVTGKSDYATPHEILGVQPGATGEQIRNAFKQQILKWHPDKNKSPEAKDAFNLIKWAEQELSK